MNNGKNRASLLGVVAAYLVYTAWELFQGRNNPDTSMTPAVAVLFAVLFALAAGGLLFLAFRTWQRSDQDDTEKKEDPNSLK